MSILEQLRAATGARHKHLEDRLVIGRGEVDCGAWSQYLRCMGDWLDLRNTAVWSRPWPARLLPERRLAKAAWLQDDLAKLGVSPASARQGSRPLTPNPGATAAELLGWAYVIEGSMLGGRTLRAPARAALGFSPRFLEGYGDATGPMWRALVAELEHVGEESSLACLAMMDAACLAFDDITAWMFEGGAAVV